MTELYFNLNDVILILSIGVSLLLSVFQSVFNTKNTYSRVLLAAFFLSIAVADTGIMLIWNEHLPISHLLNITVPYFYTFATLIKGPLLVYYVKSITQDKFSPSVGGLVHFLPSLVIVGLLYTFNIDINLFRLDQVGIEHTTYFTTDMIWWAIKIIPLTYFCYALTCVYFYQRDVVSDNSEVNEAAIIWLYAITIAFVAANGWSVVLGVLANVFGLPFGVTENYLNFILLISLFFYSVSQSQQLTLARSSKPKQAATTGSLQHIIDGINIGIEQKKLYLNQSINIEQFSDAIDLSARDVSFAINREFGTNFFEFINSHRVEEVKRYLSDSKYSHMSILDISLESGFNSKSSFQRFFKRLTGMSPSEFRSSQAG